MRLSLAELERMVAMALLVVVLVAWAKAPQWSGAERVKEAHAAAQMELGRGAAIADFRSTWGFTTGLAAAD